MTNANFHLNTLYLARRFDIPKMSWHFTKRAKKKSFPGSLPIERIAQFPRNGSTLRKSYITFEEYCSLFLPVIETKITSLCGMNYTSARSINDLDYALCNFQNADTISKCEIYYSSQVIQHHETDILNQVDSFDLLASEIVLEAQSEIKYQTTVLEHFGPNLRNFLEGFNRTEFIMLFNQKGLKGRFFIVGWSGIDPFMPGLSNWGKVGAIIQAWKAAFKTLVENSDLMVATTNINDRPLSPKVKELFTTYDRVVNYGSDFRIFDYFFENITLGPMVPVTEIAGMIQIRSDVFLNPLHKIINARLGDTNFDNISDLFENTTTPLARNCITTKKNFTQLVAGPGNGFQMTMFTGSVDLAQDSVSLPLNKKSSMTIYFDDQSHDILTSSQKYTVFEPGKKISIGLKSETYKSLPEPKGTCDLKAEIPETVCVINCFTEKVNSLCGCHPRWATFSQWWI